MLFALSMAIGCATKTQNTYNPKKIEIMQENLVTTQTGIIDFWEDLGKYTISYSIPNTIDSQYTCVVPQAEMIPESLRKAGSKVVFSGTISKDPSLPPPRMGGQEIFLVIKLDSIKPFQ